MCDRTYVIYEQEDPRNKGIWLPSLEDSNHAIKSYLATKEQDLSQAEECSLKSPAEIMKVNGLITQQIFDHNKDSHDVFVQESYVLPWMFPYLEPCGPIMKLNAKPTRLTNETIAKDRTYWNNLTNKLLNDPIFLKDYTAQKSFSKLRAAIGGLYFSRSCLVEAEHAFNQSIRLFPGSPEAHFRLANLFAKENRFDEAIETMDSFIKWKPMPVNETGAYTVIKNKSYADHVVLTDQAINNAKAFRKNLLSMKEQKTNTGETITDNMPPSTK